MSLIFQGEKSKPKNSNIIYSLELIHENEKLGNEIEQRELEVSKLNEAISRLNFYENPGIAYTLEQKYLLENKIRELEKESRVLIEDKGKIEVEYKITSERYNDLKRKYDDLRSEVSFNKMRDSESISNLEVKISQLKETNDIYKVENKTFRTNEDKHKYEMIMIKNEKERLEEKYNKTKSTKDELLKKVIILEAQVKSLSYEKEYALIEKKKNDEEKRARIEMKNQCIEQMKSNISNFKNEVMRSRSKNK